MSGKNQHCIAIIQEGFFDNETCRTTFNFLESTLIWWTLIMPLWFEFVFSSLKILSMLEYFNNLFESFTYAVWSNLTVSCFVHAKKVYLTNYKIKYFCSFTNYRWVRQTMRHLGYIFGQNVFIKLAISRASNSVS